MKLPPEANQAAHPAPRAALEITAFEAGAQIEGLIRKGSDDQNREN